MTLPAVGSSSDLFKVALLSLKKKKKLHGDSKCEPLQFLLLKQVEASLFSSRSRHQGELRPGGMLEVKVPPALTL